MIYGYEDQSTLVQKAQEMEIEIADLTAEVNFRQDEADDLERQVRSLKGEIAALDQRNSDLLSQISVLEYEQRMLQGAVVFPQRVKERIEQVYDYIDQMEQERQGWGPQAEKDVTDTMLSFSRALRTLMQATDIWIDGGTGYSFNGSIGGIFFGMICSKAKTNYVVDYPDPFDHAPLTWRFHS